MDMFGVRQTIGQKMLRFQINSVYFSKDKDK